ncbi:MAG: hypothetical protein DMG14_35495 [Acidobacteria bacterium]|nr:MAG: hypothetical protein DMG14_35495 [Acidobacteriota bacterium]
MGRLAITLIFELATIVMTLLPLRAQAPSARKASFEVASIKVNRTDAIGLMIDTRGDLFVATNATLRMLIRYAYSSHQVLQSYQIIGGPDWLDGPDRFDIQAKLGANVRSLPAEQVLFMLQALLEDRF